MYTSAVGIDVSSEHLDIFLSSEGKCLRCTCSEKDLRELTKTLRTAAPQVIILEATGGYEKKVVAHLVAAKLPVVVVNPRHVRSFAHAKGILAKTDKLDAKVLAEFAIAVQPQIRQLPDEKLGELSDLMDRRAQLMDMHIAETLRLQKAPPKVISAALKRHIAWLQKELESTDAELDARIQASEVWRANDDLLQSVPGVGPALSRTLIAQCPELGHLDEKAISALIGVAPFNKDSGKFRGQRAIWGGRGYIRKVLYMNALVAMRHNAKFKEFYERLITKGKATKVALVAVMRKLLITLNAILRDQKPWLEPKKS